MIGFSPSQKVQFQRTGIVFSRSLSREDWFGSSGKRKAFLPCSSSSYYRIDAKGLGAPQRPDSIAHGGACMEPGSNSPASTFVPISKYILVCLEASMFRKLCLIAFAICWLVLRAPAQTTNGQITGTITDSTGAVIPQAEVDVTNQGTSQLRSATTDNAGSYIVPQLPPGLYDISVKKAGFATQNRTNVQLQVNQGATLNFQLSVSSAAQTVNVTGTPPELNTTSATIGDVVGHEEAVDLPLNGREFTQLTLLTPGASPIQDAQQSGFAVTQGAGGISPS